MFKSKSLYHLIVYSILFIIVLVSFFTFILIDNAHDEFQEKIATLKEDFLSNKKEAIKNDISTVINFVKHYEESNKGKKSLDEIQKDIINAVQSLRPNDDPNNYVFIHDFNGNQVLYPIDLDVLDQEELEMFKFKDTKDHPVIRNIIEASKKEEGGFVEYIWYKPEIKDLARKISYAKSYEKWGWAIAKGVYLDELDHIVKLKTEEYNQKISEYTLQITTLTIMLVLYSIFIYKNATILIVNDVKEIGKYFKESQEDNKPMNQNRLMFGEFKVIANYANDAMSTIKLKTNMLEDLNKNLEFKVNQKTEELQKLISSQKSFIKNSVHEVNTPLAIIRTNIDLLKMHVPNNKYITNIESGAKIIQYIYDDLSYMIKKDRVIYEKTYLNFTEILKQRIEFFDEIAISNSLYFVLNIEDDIYIKFNQTEIQRIIDNNLSNAIKYSNSKSPIFVKLFYIDDNEVEFNISTNSKKIENVDRIFDDFYRENNARGGFGLGLKIVKEICDKNLVIINLISTDMETKFSYRFKINENTTT